MQQTLRKTIKNPEDVEYVTEWLQRAIKERIDLDESQWNQPIVKLEVN